MVLPGQQPQLQLQQLSTAAPHGQQQPPQQQVTSKSSRGVFSLPNVLRREPMYSREVLARALSRVVFEFI